MKLLLGVLWDGVGVRDLLVRSSSGRGVDVKGLAHHRPSRVRGDQPRVHQLALLQVDEVHRDVQPARYQRSEREL